MSLSHIALSSGCSIELTELRMSWTYGGMLEGYPCKPVNDMKVRRLQRQAERAFPSTPVHAVPPSREYPDQAAGAFGPVEVLRMRPPLAHESVRVLRRCAGTAHHWSGRSTTGASGPLSPYRARRRR
ncbi:hypothetical protein GCM10018780_56630 [Streptomyces lanatus]|nr:hypothetical protein GCM10018780_56630 [Streptomyces lanatus]